MEKPYTEFHTKFATGEYIYLGLEMLLNPMEQLFL